MGESLSKITTYIQSNTIANNVRSVISRKRKRDDEYEDADEESNLVLERTMHTPKRKKLICTSQYIYQALFKEGKGSDVRVVVLGKSWDLHRVYLAQSPYFSSMFCGSWKETTEDVVRIEVVDPNINLESLSTVLGSLYQDELTLQPAKVVTTLATAGLFQLDGIIDQCVEIMLESINIQTVISYYNTACLYSLRQVKDATFKWLLVNLLSFVHERPDRLKEISADLLTSLVKSPDLFVMQIEFSVYTLLRSWLFLQLDPGSHSLASCQQYFVQLQGPQEFLLTATGAPYAPVFRCLRYNHLLNHSMDLEMLHTDHIVPREWINKPSMQLWTQMLRLDQGLDRGPREVSPEQFAALSVRCGRSLKCEGENVWRWTGFNFGLDLVWSVAGRTLKLRRNHRTDSPSELFLSQQHKRHVVLRVTVASLDEQRQVKHCQTTGVKSLTLCKNNEIVLLVLDADLSYPLHISVNLLVTSPQESEKPAAAVTKQIAESVSSIRNESG